jgi:hypothetical protein
MIPSSITNELKRYLNNAEAALVEVENALDELRSYYEGGCEEESPDAELCERIFDCDLDAALSNVQSAQGILGSE